MQLLRHIQQDRIDRKKAAVEQTSFSLRQMAEQIHLNDFH